MNQHLSHSLDGKKFLVTGGSRGIGAAIVHDLAQRGAQVAFTYSSRAEAAEDVRKELPGGGHFCLPLQLTEEASVTQLCGQVLERFASLDGVVFNAGVTADSLLLRMKTADFDRVLNTNLRGQFLLTRTLLRPMLKARKGSLVYVTSVIGQTGNAGQANYAASKAGTEAFAKSVALEVASRGLRVNCVAPGFISTDMTDVLSLELKEKILQEIPLGRIAEPKEVAAVVAFLLSDEASYITGQTLSVNGGMYRG
jgi:3-oxoacyl-[acyl-carrier protein] reductase